MMSWSYYEPPLERDACEACGGSGIDERDDYPRDSCFGSGAEPGFIPRLRYVVVVLDYPCDRCGGSGAEPGFIPIQKEE